MDKNVEKQLMVYLKNHTLLLDYTFSDLFFNTYAEMTFKNIEDLAKLVNEFYDFLQKNISIIKFDSTETSADHIQKLIKNSKEHTISMLNLRDMNNIKYDFTDQIIDAVDAPENKHLLDVGPGHSPISSMLFAKKFKKVTAMDSYFFISSLALKNMNIDIKRQYFDENADVSDYDIVVGRCACTAIKNIVEVCTKQNKPYFIELCGCNLNSSQKTDAESFGWELILPKIDQNIAIYKNFAFNLHIDPSKITFEIAKKHQNLTKFLQNKPSKKKIIKPLFELDKKLEPGE